jgi:hypothetical protein
MISSDSQRGQGLQASDTKKTEENRVAEALHTIPSTFYGTECGSLKLTKPGMQFRYLLGKEVVCCLLASRKGRAQLARVLEGEGQTRKETWEGSARALSREHCNTQIYGSCTSEDALPQPNNTRLGQPYRLRFFSFPPFALHETRRLEERSKV